MQARRKETVAVNGCAACGASHESEPFAHDATGKAEAVFLCPNTKTPVYFYFAKDRERAAVTTT